jgi:hypothetical protein
MEPNAPRLERGQSRGDILVRLDSAVAQRSFGSEAGPGAQEVRLMGPARLVSGSFTHSEEFVRVRKPRAG